MNTYLSLISTFFFGKSSRRFIVGVIFSLAFSISVILCTLGLMDGFDIGLKSSLKNSFGDYVMFNREGFFELDPTIIKTFENHGLIHSDYLKTEGFFLFKSFSKGLVIHGIEEKSYSNVTGLKLVSLEKNEVIIGSELAAQAGAEVGDSIVITLAQGKGQFRSLPKLFQLKVAQVIEHGIYDKDLRFAYLQKSQLQEMMDLGEKINLIALKSLNAPGDLKEQSDFLEQQLLEIDQNLDPLLVIKPFWAEYETLIEAVEVEKVSITIILQIIVFVAVFNVLAFVIFLNERKSKEIFIFQTLGMGPRKIFWGWILMISFIWFVSCLVSILFKEIFSFTLNNFEAFSLPGDIYTLSNIELFIATETYLMVFSLAFVWLMLCSLGLFATLKGKSLLSRLRMEYN